MKIETGVLDVHPLAAAVKCQTKKSMTHRFTMENFGQIEPLTIVMRDGKALIIDGVERFEVAKQLPSLFPTLDCRIVEIEDSKIIDKRILLNSTRKQSIREKCLLVENVLGVLGKKPGVKRIELGLENLNAELKFSSKIKKDRFHWACLMTDSDCSPSTLRKLMFIYNAEDTIKEELLDKIDSGRLTIDKAFKLLNSKKQKIDAAEILKLNHFGNGKKGWFKLFCKSSLSMEEIEDGSVRIFIISPPYWLLRHYRNQGLNPFGREATVEEYIGNLMNFIREIRKKLMKNGVLVLIIGETYNNGNYQGVCTKAEVAIENEGMRILDNNAWCKLNPRPTSIKSRFLNAKEEIIVACNSREEEPVFNPITKPSSVAKFKVMRSGRNKNGDEGYYMAAPDAQITNVFTTSVFNRKEHSVIDTEFQHDAPAPQQIYETFIKAYSMPGDTVVDSFVGGGSVGVALKLGRNVLGYDIDPESIEFCRKRFDRILGEEVETLSIAA